MTKSMRHGTRFNGGGVTRVRATGYIPHFRPWEMRAPAAQSKLESAQNNSVQYRMKRGIAPSMPRFSFDEPIPEPPPPPEIDWARIAEKLYAKHQCKAVGIISQHGNHVVIAMQNDDAAFTICIHALSKLVLWTEGPAPYIRRKRTSKCRNRD